MKRMTLAIAISLLSLNCLAPQVYAEGINADNTKKNSKAVSGEKPTAQNQSNEKSSVERSAELRRAIMKKKGLSVNAQNVKLIDENGKLTLRGPVDSAKEKNIIEDLAKNCYGKDYVSELEIKSSK
ncbi:MAG TPA: BON domain-containing protein [Drouetiella sp.]|jgi:hyperosmotically inducible periplasmic protein